MRQWHQECVDWSVVFGDIEVSVGVDTALIPFVSVSAAMGQLFSVRINPASHCVFDASKILPTPDKRSSPL
jgi:hypothetical protein